MPPAASTNSRRTSGRPVQISDTVASAPKCRRYSVNDVSRISPTRERAEDGRRHGRKDITIAACPPSRRRPPITASTWKSRPPSTSCSTSRSPASAVAPLAAVLDMLDPRSGPGSLLVIVLDDPGGLWRDHRPTWGRSCWCSASFVAWNGYFILFEGLRQGQTPGKRIAGIRVVMDTGHAVSFGAAAARNLLRIADCRSPALSDRAAARRLPPPGQATGGPRGRHRRRAGSSARAPAAAAARTSRRRVAIHPGARGRGLPAARAVRGPSRTSSSPRPGHGSRTVWPPGFRRIPLAPVRATWRICSRSTRPSSPGVRAASPPAARPAPGPGSRPRSGRGGTNSSGWPIERRETDWTASASSELPDFAARYREVAADLARARTYRADRATQDRLERLAAAGHNVLYRDDRSTWGRLWIALARECPAAVIEARRYVLVAFLTFIIPAGVGFMVLHERPALAVELLPDVMLRRAEAGQARKAAGRGYVEIAPEDRGLMASGIITNNVRVAIACFAGGVFLGVGSLILLAYNGLAIGAFAGHFANVGLAGLSPHLHSRTWRARAVRDLGRGSGGISPGALRRRARHAEQGRRAGGERSRGDPHGGRDGGAPGGGGPDRRIRLGGRLRRGGASHRERWPVWRCSRGT